MPHSIYSPSASSRWLHCTASIDTILAMGQRKPAAESFASKEGSCAHELLEQSIIAQLDDCSEFLGQPLYEGVKVDQEMIDNVNLCLEIIWATADSWGLPRDQVKSEAVVYAPSIHPDCFGTVDITILAPHLKKFAIYDLKYGKGIAVDTKDNTQLLIYAIGVLDTHGWEHYDEAYLGILQPRIEGGSMELEEPIDVFELEMKANEYEQIVKDIEIGKTVYKPSETACRWCPGVPNCKAHDERIARVTEKDFEEILGFTLEEKYELVPLLKVWINKIEEEMISALMTGEEMEHFELGTTKKHAKWDEELTEDELMEQIEPFLKPYGAETIDVLQPRKFVTPAACKKLIQKSGLELLESKLSYRPTGDMKVVKKKT